MKSVTEALKKELEVIPEQTVNKSTNKEPKDKVTDSGDDKNKQKQEDVDAADSGDDKNKDKSVITEQNNQDISKDQDNEPKFSDKSAEDKDKDVDKDFEDDDVADEDKSVITEQNNQDISKDQDNEPKFSDKSAEDKDKDTEDKDKDTEDKDKDTEDTEKAVITEQNKQDISKDQNNKPNTEHSSDPKVESQGQYPTVSNQANGTNTGGKAKLISLTNMTDSQLVSLVTEVINKSATDESVSITKNEAGVTTIAIEKNVVMPKESVKDSVESKESTVEVSDKKEQSNAIKSVTADVVEDLAKKVDFLNTKLAAFEAADNKDIPVGKSVQYVGDTSSDSNKSAEKGNTDKTNVEKGDLDKAKAEKTNTNKSATVKKSGKEKDKGAASGNTEEDVTKSSVAVDNEEKLDLSKVGLQLMVATKSIGDNIPNYTSQGQDALDRLRSIHESGNYAYQHGRGAKGAYRKQIVKSLLSAYAVLHEVEEDPILKKV